MHQVLAFVVLVTFAVRTEADVVRQNSQSSPSFQIVDNDGFSVSIRDVPIFTHKGWSPAVFVGNGEDQVREYSGNFFYSSFVEERVALTKYSVANSTDDGYNVFMASDSENDSKYWLTLHFHQESDGLLVMNIANSSLNFNRLWVRFAFTKEDRVYGGGEQFTYFNLRGNTFPIWTREQGVGRNKSSQITFLADEIGKAGGDYYTTYFSQPTLLGTRSNSSSYSYYTYFLVHYTGSSYGVLDLSQDNFTEMFLEGPYDQEAWYFQVQDSPSACVSSLTARLGRMEPLPTWLYQGAILGVQGGTEQMMQRLSDARAAHIPVAGLWIQDWSGKKDTPFGQRVFWNWQWDQQYYPNLNDTISVLRTEGVRVLAYINPSLDNRGPLFTVAQDKGYLVKNQQQQTYLMHFGSFVCGMVDFTNPQAYNWYKDDVLKANLIGLGFGGWMADFGEYLPRDAVLASGEPARLHNLWPVLWAQLNRQAVREMGQMGQDIVFFSRSGFSGTSNATMLMWAGDQNVDWSMSDGAASTIPAALSVGLSGVGLTHFDIGGYTTYSLPSLGLKMVRSEERLLRSAEHAVFGPVFRTHEGNIPPLNSQYYSSEYSMKCFQRLVSMFVTLAPYHEHVVNLTAANGLPAQRPLFLGYPRDRRSLDVSYQYLYGDDLLVAPVYLPGQLTWTLYLPNATALNHTWVYLWNSSLMSSGGVDITVPAPVGQPPVFYRSSSTFLPTFTKMANMSLVPAPQPPTTHPTPSNTTAPSPVPPSRVTSGKPDVTSQSSGRPDVTSVSSQSPVQNSTHHQGPGGGSGVVPSVWVVVVMLCVRAVSVAGSG